MRRVALNDVWLDEIDSRIIISGIEEGEPKLNWSAVSLFGGVGQRVTSHHRESLDVTVKFALRITSKHLTARSELLEKITGWAAEGGWLRLNYRQNRRLRVVCAALPGIDDLAKWDSEYTITFRAYGVPYWQQVTPATLTIASTKSMNRSMEVAGTADSVLNMTFTNISGMEISTLTVATEHGSFAFKSLGLKADESLVIDHTAAGLLRIRIQNTAGTYRSAMAMRTPESADDLLISPGASIVTLTAQRAGRVVLTCYGRYV